MAVDLAPAIGTTNERPQAALDSIWRGPLVPVALAATAGIVADRYGSLSLGTAFAAVVVALVTAGALLWKKQEAAEILDGLVESETFVEFLTFPAYEYLD